MTAVAGTPQTKSCILLALLVASKLVGSRPWLRSHAWGSWLTRMNQAACLCHTRSHFFREATSRPSRPAVCFLHVVEEVTEQLIPEEHKTGGEGSLQQAGRQALEEALRAFLPKYLPGTIQEALVASNLGRGRLVWLRREVITTWTLALFFCEHNAWHIKFLINTRWMKAKRRGSQPFLHFQGA